MSSFLGLQTFKHLQEYFIRKIYLEMFSLVAFEKKKSFNKGLLKLLADLAERERDTMVESV